MAEAVYTPRLKTLYEDVIRAKMQEQFSFSNPHQMPKLEKVVLNMGVGEAVNDSKKVKSALEDLQAIAGQQPVITKARKSIATFKVREGMPIGVKVTLRGDRMYEFLDRLITIALPRVRDFRGLNGKSFDGNGNYAMGLKEHIVFPEIDYDKVDQIWGMDIIVCTSTSNDDEARALLKEFNFPFKPLRSRGKYEENVMAKKSAVEKNKARARLADKYAAKRAKLKALAKDESLSLEERFKARLKLAELPRNSASIRIRNRCEVTGRPRGYYRKLKMSRISLRELGNEGKIPGLVKSSW